MIPFEQFNTIFNVIEDVDLTHKYQNCFMDIGRHFNHPHFYLGLVAYCILFHDSGIIALQERSRIGKIFEEADRLIQVGTDTLSEDIGKLHRVQM